MEKLQWEKTASMLFTLCVGGAIVYLAVRYALPVVFPFAFAWLLAYIIRRPARRFAARVHLSEKLCAVILLLLLLGIIIWLLGASLQRMFSELQQLAESLLSDGGGITEALGESIDYFEALTSRIGFLRRIGAGDRFAAFRDRFNEAVSSMLEGLLESLSAAIPSFAGRVLSALPSVLLSIVITVIAGFYFCIDGEGTAAALTAILPARIRKCMPAWCDRIKRFSKGYLRAYLLLLLLTFAELFLGFCILRVEYAFLLALLIALVDLLPVLGVGAVLVPWSIVLLLQKNYYLGFGLLILFAAVTVLRQIMEPKLLGKSLGLHPLLTLFASYAGWELFGVVGMILGPIAALGVKSLLALRAGRDVDCEKRIKM